MDIIPPSPYERLSYLRNDINLRLNTFRNWPTDIPVTVQDLVNDGFYYTGLEDKVQCTHCGGILSGWCTGDVVYMEHNRHFPQCPLVISRRRQQIPALQQQCLPTQPVSAPILQPYGFNFSHQAETGETFETRYTQASNWADSPGQNRPKYPEYSKEHSRQLTFKGWPSQIQQRPEALVKSGFFYMGEGDKVKCFFCGGILWDWETGDNEFEEHAKWFPQCPWLKLTKGKGYIDEVQKKLQEQQEREERENLVQQQQEHDQPMTDIQNQDHQLVESQQYGHTSIITSPTEDVESSLCVSSMTTMMEQASIAEKGEYVNGAEDTKVKSISDEETENNVAVSSIEARAVSSSASPTSPPSLSSAAAGAVRDADDDLPKDIKSIVEENKSLKEEKICKICLDEPVSIVFVPCGHMVCCPNCAVSVNDCPMCRKPINDRIKAYW